MAISKEALDELEKTNPDLVAQYRAKTDPANQGVAQAQTTQDYGTLANLAGKALNDYGNAGRSDVILHNRMQDLGQTPTVKAASQRAYDPSVIDNATARNVARAKESQNEAETGFWNEEKLKDRGQAQVDATKARDKAARSADGKSAESAAAREFLKQRVPAAGSIPNFDSLSENQVEKISPGLFEKFKIDQETALKREEMTQRSADRRDAAQQRSDDKNEARQWRAEDKLTAATAKESTYQAGVKIDDTEVKPGFRPTADDAKKSKEAKMAYDKVTSALDEMDAIHKRSGTNLVGDDSNRMASLKTSILMSQKELDKLGVLSGQDEKLTLDQIPDPTSWLENAKGMIGQDSYATKSDQYRRNLNNQYDATLGATGYVRKGKPKQEAFPGRKAGGVRGSDLPD